MCRTQTIIVHNRTNWIGSISIRVGNAYLGEYTVRPKCQILFWEGFF